MSTLQNMDNHAQSTETLKSRKFGVIVTPEQPYPTPNPLSPQTAAIPQTVPQSYQSTASSSSSLRGSLPPGAPIPKVAISRLAGADISHGRRRSARACEPCRQRKIKCDGLRPCCSQCTYYNHSCYYEDVKRVRDQKRLGSLVKCVEAYETLLRELEGEVDLPTARKIRKAVKVCS
jgi:hypothetical protein